MYTVMVRMGNTGKAKRKVFESADEADAYFQQLCERRTDYEATAVLAYRLLVKKRYRLDKKWRGKRMLLDEGLEP